MAENEQHFDNRHSREGGDPAITPAFLDSRLRGNDGVELK